MKSSIGMTGLQISFLPWLGYFLNYCGTGG
jgi:hypothetical protein